MTNRTTIRRRWLREHPAPWVCHFCNFEVHTPEIHHLDHDKKNNVESNLAPAHPSCHDFYHSLINKVEAKPHWLGAMKRAMARLDKKEPP